MQFFVTAITCFLVSSDPVSSDPAGPVALTIALEDNPNNLTANGTG